MCLQASVGTTFVTQAEVLPYDVTVPEGFSQAVEHHIKIHSEPVALAKLGCFFFGCSDALMIRMSNAVCQFGGDALPKDEISDGY